jgi:hypothetical protein
MTNSAHDSIVGNRLQAMKATSKSTSAAALRKLFKACDLRENGREPNWEDHLKVMEESRKAGRSGT